MGSNDGMHFDRCLGLQSKGEDGNVFDANTLDCRDKPLNAGESILVSNRPYLYRGDDNGGNSIFVPLESFPQPEVIERIYKDNLVVVLEIYTTRKGRFYVWPYVQMGLTSSGNYTRQVFQFDGVFHTREAAIEAAWAAGNERIDALYSPLYSR